MDENEVVYWYLYITDLHYMVSETYIGLIQ